MPPVASVLQTKIDSMFEAAFERAVIQTAVFTELNNLVVVPDTRPADVRAFEYQVLTSGGFTTPDKLLAEKVFGATFNTVLPTPRNVKPVWHGVFKLVKPEFSTMPQYTNVVEWNSVWMYVNSRGKVRDASGRTVGMAPMSNVLVPATEDEIRTYLTGLFAARPAATLKLFRIPAKDGVIGSDGSEEE